MTRSIFFLLIILTFITPVLAVDAIIDPDNVTIYDAAPGDTFTIVFNVTNPGNVTAEYSLEPVGDIELWTGVSWTSLPVIRNVTLKVTLQPKASHEFNATITIPKDTKDGKITGSILIKSVTESSVGTSLPITVFVKGQGVSVREVLRYVVILVVIGILVILFRTKPKSTVRHFVFRKDV